MENRVQVIFEALNRTKATYQELWRDTDNFRLKATELDSFLKQGIGIGMFYGLIREAKTAVDTIEQTGNSVKGLAAVARYSGEDIGKSLDAAMKLAEDGLINVREASQSLQNLLSRGYSLEESIAIVNRLKDAAAFNRQSHLSMGEAVRSATEGLKNENSILVDNAGVTKNVSVMWKEYAREIGTSVEKLTQAQKRQAEYNGIMKETEAQVGNATLAIDGITGAKARMSQEVFKLRNALGEGETGLFFTLGRGISWALQQLRAFLGGIEITGARFGLWSMKIGAVVEWIKGGFTGGTDALKGEFNRLNQVFDEQAAEIVAKWEGKIESPNIGRDSGKRRTDTTPPPEKDKKGAKEAADWAKIAADLRTDLAKVGLDELDKKLTDLKAKAEELRKKPKSDKGLIGEWLTGMSNAAIDDEIKKLDDEILDLEEKRAAGEAEWQESLRRRAEAAKAAREAEISYQLSVIDTQEKYFQLDKTDATQQRIALTKELLQVQENFLSQIDRLQDPTGWLTQQQAIQGTRDKLLELELKLRELTGNMGEGMREGLKRYMDEARTEFQQGRDLAQGTAQAMEQGFSDLFFNVMQGKLSSLTDVWRSFASSIQRMMADIAAQQIVVWILNALGLAKKDNLSTTQGEVGATAALAGTMSVQTGIVYMLTSAYWALAAAKAAAGEGGYVGGSSGGFGGLVTAHTGGLILHEGGLVPRFHFGGLASDEVPAILQTRERVLSRDQNVMFENMYKQVMQDDRPAAPVIQLNVNAMDAKSFYSYMMENREATAAVLASLTADNHSGVRRMR